MEALVDPETGAHFVLTRVQRRFLRRMYVLAPNGRLLYPEATFSGPKKSGKTTLAALCGVFTVRILGGRFAEGFCVANDLEQSQGRVFQAICRIVEANPVLAADADITANKVTFSSTGAAITALASDYAGAAGSNHVFVSFDELWGVTTEAGQRLWDEMVPVPTRRISQRLVTSYAGFEGESALLEGLYKRGLKGDEIEPDLYVQPGMLMFWTHKFSAPWQTPEWREQMRGSLRANAYLRIVENRWVSTDSTFVEMEWWDKCVDPAAAPIVADRSLSVWVGSDASLKRDSTAIVACAWDAERKKVRLVAHRIFQPSAAEPLDFERTVEAALFDMCRRFDVREIRYDPWQMAAVAQRLVAAGLPMAEFPQSMPNLTEASTNLYELVKGGNLIAYHDDAIRLAVQRSIAVETTRGWRIAKEKASHKIDIVVALAQAALGAVKGGVDAVPWSDPNLRAGLQDFGDGICGAERVAPVEPPRTGPGQSSFAEASAIINERMRGKR